MNNDMNRGNDTARHDALEHDNIRDDVTWQDSTTYSMALPQVYARFVEAGLDRSLRTLQRYCEQGHLRAAKYPTETGAVWYVDPDSVETKIEEIRQVQETLHRPAAPRHDMPLPTTNDTSRPDADRRAISSSEHYAHSHDMASATDSDDPRKQKPDVARRSNDPIINETDSRDRQPTSDSDDKYVTVPVVMLDALTAQLAAKDEQIKRRDAQMEQLVNSHDQDRQLLGAALAIIHRDDFAMELGEGEASDANEDPAPAEEIKPEFHQDWGNPQPPHQSGGL
jgi:hypothetical protein